MRKRAHTAELVLRLYTAGNAPNSLRAIANAKALCDRHFSARYDIEIIDLLDQPQRAVMDRIIVTPTLVRVLPAPMRRVIGNLGDTDQVLLVLKG